MGNTFLIPANSKKSMLILGFFNMTDIIIFGSGCILTFIFLFAVQDDTLGGVIFKLAPALITSFLVLPIPNQHNVRTFIKNLFMYLVNPKTYYWKGWCVKYDEKSK